MVKKTHIHWVYGKNTMQRVSHPVSTKHRNIESRLKHDIETGKFKRWTKGKNLRMLDSTYERYENEVLRR